MASSMLIQRCPVQQQWNVCSAQLDRSCAVGAAASCLTNISFICLLLLFSLCSALANKRVHFDMFVFLRDYLKSVNAVNRAQQTQQPF